MVVEDNTFGTHEFMDLCEKLGCDAYVTGNLGSGTVREMQDWVDYISCPEASSMSGLRMENGRKKPWKLPFFGVGNENWACGGNMRAEYYADLYRRYQTYIRSYPGNTLKKIACGPNDDDYEWTDTVMKNASRHMWGLSMHYYTKTYGNFENIGDSVEFGEDEWHSVLKNTYLIDEYIKGHSKVMDKYDPDSNIALVVDEWGTWYKSLEGTNRRFLHQQNTIRDAVSAAIHFNIFHRNCKRVKMANLAQTVNVLQAVILTYGETMIKTPTYHVFDMYKCHKDNITADVSVKCRNYRDIPGVDATASIDEENNRIYCSFCNLDPSQGKRVSIIVSGAGLEPEAYIRILSAPSMNSCNSPEKPDSVRPRKAKKAGLKENVLEMNMPPRAVATVEFRKHPE
jgi:alpha-N-arabinofuranosidase